MESYKRYEFFSSERSFIYPTPHPQPKYEQLLNQSPSVCNTHITLAQIQSEANNVNTLKKAE